MVWLGAGVGGGGGGGGGGSVPQNNLNLEALKFWQRFVLPNHSQKRFHIM
jgi:hypothetical protein